MHTSQVTSTGIAVAVAVVVALALLFFGPRIFSPFSAKTAVQTATTTGQIVLPTDSASTTAMDTQAQQPQSVGAIPNPLPTTLTGTEVVIGTGAEAVPGKEVTVDYVGMLPDGKVFDASKSHGQPFTFKLGGGQVIRGWDQGVVGMKVGGTRRLIIPPDLAYGSQGAGGVIPPNATLIFDIQLLGVK